MPKAIKSDSDSEDEAGPPIRHVLFNTSVTRFSEPSFRFSPKDNASPKMNGTLSFRAIRATKLTYVGPMDSTVPTVSPSASASTGIPDATNATEATEATDASNADANNADQQQPQPHQLQLQDTYVFLRFGNWEAKSSLQENAPLDVEWTDIPFTCDIDEFLLRNDDLHVEVWTQVRFRGALNFSLVSFFLPELKPEPDVSVFFGVGNPAVDISFIFIYQLAELRHLYYGPILFSCLSQ
jgi:hypothetical protein